MQWDVLDLYLVGRYEVLIRWKAVVRITVGGALCLTGGFVSPVAAQDYLNLQLTRRSQLDERVPWGWRLSGAQLDRYSVRHHCVAEAVGRCRVEVTSSPGAATLGAPQPLYILRETSASGVAGRAVELLVRATSAGSATLEGYLRSADANGRQLDSIGAIVPATGDRSRLIARGRIAQEAKRIWIILVVSGPGTVTLEETGLRVGGRSLDAIIAQRAPSRSSLAALRASSTFLRSDLSVSSAEATGLARILRSASVIALAEGTHGTHEIFSWRSSAIKALVMSGGVSSLGLEASAAGAREVDSYISGVTDELAPQHELGFWSWDNAETRDLLRWLRRFNATASTKVRVWGFDTQGVGGSADSLLAYVEARAPGAAGTMRTVLSPIVSQTSRDPLDAGNRTAAQGFLASARRASAIVDSIALADSTSVRAEWAAEYARILVQSGLQRVAVFGGRPVRDSIMAQNALRAIARGKGKTILLGHHFHLAKTGRSQGAFLASALGDRYRVIGSVFGAGDYLAESRGGLSLFAADVAPPGSIEHALQLLGGGKMVLLDLTSSQARADSWLGGMVEIRQIGLAAREPGFEPADLRSRFDGLVYFGRTTAACTTSKLFVGRIRTCAP